MIEQSRHRFRRESAAAELGRECPPEFGGALGFSCALGLVDKPRTHASHNLTVVFDNKRQGTGREVTARNPGLHGLSGRREIPRLVEQVPAYVAAPVEDE